MPKDYFEINLKQLIQKCRPTAYRPEFKADLFRQMTREIKLNPQPVPKWRADIFINWLHPVGFRLFLEAAAVPLILIFVGISLLLDSSQNGSLTERIIIVSQPADRGDHGIGNSHNSINYFTHVSSSHGSCQIRPEIQGEGLQQKLLQWPATNNS